VIQPLCPWGRPHYLASDRQPTPDIYARVFGGVAFGEVDYRNEGDDVSALGLSASGGLQYYTGERIALRLRASGSEPLSSETSVEARGYALAVGARAWLPDVRQAMRWSVTLDGEWADGLDLARNLAPLPRGDDRSLSFASGLAMSGMPHELGPITWFVRYLHSETSEQEPLRALDFGVGLGSYLTSWQNLRELGARAGYRHTHELASPGYRANEFELEFSYRVSKPVAVGIEGDLTLFTAGGTHRAVVLRFDYYYETEE
jgi:hypothetical protein